jgi:H+/Cl- antiporter ClcA
MQSAPTPNAANSNPRTERERGGAAAASAEAAGAGRGRPVLQPGASELRRLLWPAVAVGAGGGLAGLAYLAALRGLQSLLWPQGEFGWFGLAVLLSAGALAGLLPLLLGDPGGVDLMVDNIHVLGGPRDIRELKSLLPISLVCIAAGGAAGPEAPLVQSTGSLGAWLADRFRLSVADRRILTITGMAAGFTVLFGVPLGAAVFALEILHRDGLEYHEALLPSVIGALCGYAIFSLASGTVLLPVWSFPPLAALRAPDLGWAVVAGGIGAVVSIGFIQGQKTMSRLLRRLPRPLRPVAGALGLAALATASPYALTYGEGQIGELIAAHPAATLFALAAAVKLLATLTTISSEWRGGFIIPLFFIGAALGRLLHIGFPGANEIVLMTALMAAINTGVTKTPIGSMLVVTGMAGLRLAPTTLIAALICLLITGKTGLIEHQRSRKRAQAEPEHALAAGAG